MAIPLYLKISNLAITSLYKSSRSQLGYYSAFLILQYLFSNLRKRERETEKKGGQLSFIVRSPERERAGWLCKDISSWEDKANAPSQCNQRLQPYGASSRTSPPVSSSTETYQSPGLGFHQFGRLLVCRHLLTILGLATWKMTSFCPRFLQCLGDS